LSIDDQNLSLIIWYC